MVRQKTLAAPLRFRTFTASKRVAPVVVTSSTKIRFCPWTSAPAESRKELSKFFILWSFFKSFCVLVGLQRTSRLSAEALAKGDTLVLGRESSRAKVWHKTSAWLKPRQRW